MFDKKPAALNYPKPLNVGDSRLEILAKENNSIMNSSRMVDDAISLSSQTMTRMDDQMRVINNANDRLTTIIQSVPYLGELAQGIQVRRKRDRLILGGLIGFLMFFIVWYLFG